MENNVTYYTFTQQTPLDMQQTGSFPVQTSSQKSITMADGTAWPAIVREFANFLSGIYGYDIASKLLIEEWDGDHSRPTDYGV